MAGGLGTIIKNLEGGLLDAGVDVSVFSPGHNIQESVDSKVVESFGVDTGSGVEHVELRQRRGMWGKENIFFFSSPDADSPLNVSDVYERKYHKAALFAAAFRDYFNRKLMDKKVILHAHDYHSGLSASIIKSQNPKIPFLYTIHLISLGKFGDVKIYESLLRKYRLFDVFPRELLDKYRVTQHSLPELLLGRKTLDRITREGSFYLEPIISHFADRVNTVGRSYLKYDVLPKFIRSDIPDEKFTYIFNGMRVDDMVLKNFSQKMQQRKRVLASLGLDDGPLYINIGRQNTGQKGTDVLVSAISLVLKSQKADDARFVVVAGEKDLKGNVKTILADLQEEYPENVHVFTEWVEDILPYYVAADVFLIPSRWEPFGLTQLEAMTRGAVVIGARTGGIRDVQVNFDSWVDEEFNSFKKPTGMLCGLGNSRSLRTRILDMHKLIDEKPQEYRMLQKNALERARYFTIERTIGGYLGLYDSLLDGLG